MKVDPKQAEQIAKHISDLVEGRKEPHEQVAYFVEKMKGLHKERVDLSGALRSLEQQIEKVRNRLSVVKSQLSGYTEDVYALDPEFHPPDPEVEVKELPEPEEVTKGDITRI